MKKVTGAEVGLVPAKFVYNSNSKVTSAEVGIVPAKFVSGDDSTVDAVVKDGPGLSDKPGKKGIFFDCYEGCKPGKKGSIYYIL